MPEERQTMMGALLAPGEIVQASYALTPGSTYPDESSPNND